MSTTLPHPHAMTADATARRPFWQVRELVMLGVFSAAAKVSTLVVALIGGGMNPVSLMAKNAVFTTLLLVLLFKIRKPGTLSLFMAVNFMISLLLLGGSVTLLVPLIIAAAVAEGATGLSGGMRKPWGPFIAAGVYDLVNKALSLGMSWLVARENPALIAVVVPFVLFGYLGSLLGLFTGWKAVKELRRAGLAAN
ncbi:MAG: hypothetical protein DELT_00243 [Desulfovibrio sp.]